MVNLNDYLKWKSSIYPTFYSAHFNAESKQKVIVNFETSPNWLDKLFLHFIQTRIEHLESLKNAFQNAISKIS